MGIVIASNFDVNTGLPLDSRTVVADTTARDAIPSLQRYEGMLVYVEADETNYQLVGGITDGDWQELSGSGGGGGGGTSTWREGTPAPLQRLVNGFEIRDFSVGDAGDQTMHLVTVLPENYVSGTPLKLIGKISGVGTTDTLLLQTSTSFFRDGVNTILTPSGPRVSTNTAIAIVNDDELLEVEMDITDGSGEIASEALLPGDTLNIAILRGTDTATSDLTVYMDTLGVRNA